MNDASDGARLKPFQPESIYDCVVIGGGAAGLSAATYLARFRRQVLVIDADESRLKWIPLARNVPGFPEGIAGIDLLARLRRQAVRYGADIFVGAARGIAVTENGFEIDADVRVSSRTVLIATGVDLVEPRIDEMGRAVQEGLIRYCPICDGFEIQDHNIGVFGPPSACLKEATFLRTYTDRVTVLCEAAAGDAGFALEAQREGVSVITDPIRSLHAAENAMEVELATGDRLHFDALYPCLGCSPRSELVGTLNGRLSSDLGVLTDKHQRTSIPGIYAAGDVIEGLDQIASAFGQAAIAATAIHNDLRELEKAASRPSHLKGGASMALNPQ